MKKIILCLLAMITIAGCSNSKVSVISAEQTSQKFANKETFILVVGVTTCIHCKELGKTIDTFSKNHDVAFFKVNIDDEDPQEVDGKKVRVDFEKLEDNYIGLVSGTPTTYFVVDGKIEFVMPGTVSNEQLKTYVEKYGFLK